MAVPYHIDLAEVTLEKFKANIKERDLIPSRVYLKDDLDRRFDKITSVGITNMKELVDALKTKPKIYAFAKESGLPAEYLTLLRREARSYLPNPISLNKFPGIPGEPVDKLAAVGIKNTRSLLNEAGVKRDRVKLAHTLEIPIEVMDEMVCLSDLVRGYGIGPVFARLFYDIDILCIQDFIEYSPKEIIKIYEKKMRKKADFGLSEIEFSLDLAKELEIIVDLSHSGK